MINGGLRTKGITKNSTAEKPLISVVTVVYNGEKTLEQTILSVVNQTYNNVEYIIIDGGSKDGSLDIIKKYADKIDYWQSETDKGIYDAMNKGIRLATGEYISLLNADDFYELDTCKIIKDEILNEKFDIYHGIERLLDKNGNVVNHLSGTKYSLNTQMLAHETCFIKKDLYEKRLYDTSYHSAADYDLICAFYRDGATFKFIERVLMNFRLDGMSGSIIGIYEGYEVKHKYGYISNFDFLCKKLYCKAKMMMGKK